MKKHNCRIHGEVKAHGSGDHLRCSVCNNERMRKKHKELQQKAILYGGGKCHVCGYSKSFAALEFHHLDPEKKEFEPSRGYKKNWETLKAELDKCVLLCANCHRELHAGEL